MFKVKHYEVLVIDHESCERALIYVYARTKWGAKSRINTKNVSIIHIQRAVTKAIWL